VSYPLSYLFERGQAYLKELDVQNSRAEAAAAGEARGAATLVELGAQLASASWLSRVRARVRVRIRVRIRAE